jgi:hypothetical protein
MAISNPASALWQLDIGLSDSIPVGSGFLSWQRYDKNWFSGPMQYRTGDTPKKGMGQKSLSVSSKDDHIATLLFCRIQYFLCGMTLRDNNF